MTRAGLSGDAMSHVVEFGLDALNVQTHQRAIGEGEDDNAGRRIRLLERYRQQIERRIRVGLRKSEMRNLQYAVEPQHTRDALLRAGLRADPVVAHAGDQKAALPRQPGHIDAFDAGVLNMRGNDPQALSVERDQLERLRETRHGLAREPRDVGAAGAKLLFQPLEAAVEVIDAIDDRLPFRRKAGNDERNRGAQVGRHHWRAAQALDAADHGGVAVELDVRAEAGELLHVHEAV